MGIVVDAEKSWLLVDVLLHYDESNDWERLCDDMRFHVSDNRETLCEADNSWLPVDEVLLDDVSDI